MNVEAREEMREQPLLLRPIDANLAVLSAQETAERPSTRWPSWLFMIVVLAPLAAAIVYNFGIASERFVSSTSYIVRENAAVTAIPSPAEGEDYARSNDNSYAIVEFVRSRDAIKLLDADGALRAMFASADVDLFSRFPSFLAGSSNEEFFEHFQHYIDADFNPSTGISTISVQAFSPAEANRIAETLLMGAEALINRLNDRARGDAIAFATQLVEEATQRLRALDKQKEGGETLAFQRALAEKSLADATLSLGAAQQNAGNSRLYLERVIEPSVPDSYGYPKRYLNVLLVLLVSLSVYWIVTKTTELFAEDM